MEPRISHRTKTTTHKNGRWKYDYVVYQTNADIDYMEMCRITENAKAKGIVLGCEIPKAKKIGFRRYKLVAGTTFATETYSPKTTETVAIVDSLIRESIRQFPGCLDLSKKC